MEREKELLKLINVLRRTGRMAMQAEWTGGGRDQNAAAYCAGRYNRVLERLKELDSGVGTVFDPLPADSPLSVVAMACRQLVAYYEDELGPEFRKHRPHVGVYGFDARAFRDFWRKSSHEVEDFGEFLREFMAEWFQQRKCGTQARAGEREGAQTAEHAPETDQPPRT